MVEAKGTPALNKDDKSPIQVNSTAELREWCAQQRKYLVAERDAAKTPDAKLIRVGMLRMLNNMESLLIQSSTTFVKQPLPTTFPRSFDELLAIFSLRRLFLLSLFVLKGSPFPLPPISREQVVPQRWHLGKR